jgi:AraC family transcriptional regulator of adaptative response/methylated-DNA-[protein]-cysteine methyltransferase
MMQATSASTANAAVFDTDADRWAAVVRRDSRADDAFFYAVRTTGVYCRPSCAARSARRENVSFHPTAAAAEAAGFRPCKRCRPNEASLAARQAAAVARACRLIERAERAPSLDELAGAAGLSRYHFHRVFKAITGLTPKGYADARRRERIRDALPRERSVTDAIYAAGYDSNAPFYRGATEALGMPPRAYRAGGAGTTIRFAVGECSLGSILVAATDRGVCAIALGDDPAALVRDLEARFARATLIGADAEFERWVATVIGFVDAPRRALDLPLDVRGTAFQQRVWRALAEIPIGATRSYTDIARRIGEPRAVRAVAQACAANPLAVAIPCHRVLRNDGGLSGYRWGVERKRALLEREARDA